MVFRFYSISGHAVTKLEPIQCLCFGVGAGAFGAGGVRLGGKYLIVHGH